MGRAVPMPIINIAIGKFAIEVMKTYIKHVNLFYRSQRELRECK